MITAPEVFGGTSSATSDPCPGYRKYVEVAFKCRPTQFREEKLRLKQPRCDVTVVAFGSLYCIDRI